MSDQFARRLADIEPFRVVEVLTRAKALEAQGRDIVHLEAGEPDFCTAQPIIDGAKRALDDGFTFYTQATGIPELRAAISNWYWTQHRVEVAPERILITPGASGALLLIAAALLDPGRGLLMTDPGYPCNRHFLRLVEGQAHLVPRKPNSIGAKIPPVFWSHRRQTRPAKFLHAMNCAICTRCACASAAGWWSTRFITA